MSLLTTVRGFIAWWVAELAGLLPRPRTGGAMLVLTPDAAGGAAAVLHRPQEAAIALPPLQPGSDGAAAVHERLPRDTRVAVAMPQALLRRVALPLAAAPRLAEVLALDMDRQTPFRAGEVVFAARILSRDRTARLVHAALCVAPVRALVEARELAARVGLPLAYAGPRAEPPWIDNLAVQHAPGTGRAARALAALALVLALAALSVPALHAEARQQAVATELAAARATLRGHEARSENRDAAVLAPGALAALGPSATLVVAALTDALPDDAVLRRLVLRDGKLEIIGSSADAAALVRLLSAAEGQSQVEFRAPLIRADGGRQLFHLGMVPRS
jgi:general secretion pathway protein L